MFRADSLYLPEQPAIFLALLQTQVYGLIQQRIDFDGEDRRAANEFVDMGADEFEGFQFTNDFGSPGDH